MGGLVSGVTGLLGGASNNSGFTAQSANIIDPVTGQQVTNAQNQAAGAVDQQQSLANALAAQNGIANQSSVYNQLQGVANGTGPNPALAQLNQATGANTANQAALMAGQRGAGANVGLLARQAAEQGAANQQNAVGQAATLQANQSQNALNSLSGLATQQVAQQQNAVTGLNSAAQGNQGQLLGALQGYNSANVQNTGNQNSTNQAMSAANASNTAGALGGISNAIGAATGLISKAAPAAAGLYSGGKVPNHLQAMASIYHPQKFAQGGKVPVMLSPGERYLDPKQAEKVADGDKNPLKSGKKVPGKAEVAGDSIKNDTYATKAEPGGIVIPKSIIQGKKPAEAAAKFVEEHLAKNGGGDENADFKMALKKAIAGRKVK